MSTTLLIFPAAPDPCDRWQQGARQGHGPDAGQAGASVATASRHEDELKFVAAEIGRETHAKVVPLAADLAHRGEVKGLAEQAIAAHGKVGIVIDNAGGDMPQPIDQITDEVLGLLRRAEFIELQGAHAGQVSQMKIGSRAASFSISSIDPRAQRFSGRNTNCKHHRQSNQQ